YAAGDWGMDCNSRGSVTVALGETKTCTITNDDIAPSLTLTKYVELDYGGTAVPANWTLYATGPTSISGLGGAVSGSNFSAGTYPLSESTGPTGYSPGSWGCTGGTLVGNNVTLGLGETASCYITNADIQPLLTVTKVVINDNGGEAVVSDFPLFVDTTSVTSGIQNGFNAGTYTVSETSQTGYTGTISGDCDANGSVTLAVGDVKACTITNDDQPGRLVVTKYNDENGDGSQNGEESVLSDWTIRVSDGENI
ncbi:MAG: hypothetical protein UX59_C0031G0001, partial [Microgenomates group bacterium GW2011_GWA1_46_7]